MIYSLFAEMFVMNIMNNKIFAGNLQKCQNGKFYFTIWRHTQRDEKKEGKKNVIPYEMCVNGLKEVMYLMAQNFELVVLLVGPTKIEYSDHKIRDFKFFIFSPTYKVSNEIIFADYSEKLGCVHAYSLGETVSFMDIDLTEEQSIRQILYAKYSAKADAEVEADADAEEDYEAEEESEEESEEEAVSEVESEVEAEVEAEVETPEVVTPEADTSKKPKVLRPNWYDVESSDEEDDVPVVKPVEKSLTQKILEINKLPQNEQLAEIAKLSLN
jgi:hypothetical protein